MLGESLEEASHAFLVDFTFFELEGGQAQFNQGLVEDQGVHSAPDL